MYQKTRVALRNTIKFLEGLKKRKSGWRRVFFPLDGKYGICYYLGKERDKGKSVVPSQQLTRMFKLCPSYSGHGMFPVRGTVRRVRGGSSCKYQPDEAYLDPRQHNWYGTVYSNNRWTFLDELIEVCHDKIRIIDNGGNPWL